jgi:hypothetical protein
LTTVPEIIEPASLMAAMVQDDEIVTCPDGTISMYTEKNPCVLRIFADQAASSRDWMTTAKVILALSDGQGFHWSGNLSDPADDLWIFTVECASP